MYTKSLAIVFVLSKENKIIFVDIINNQYIKKQ